jgi:hypothetical protein
MKRRIQIAAIALAATLVALPTVAETLDDVLSRHYEAIGGLDAWRAVETCRWNGRMVMPAGVEAPFSMTFARPLKARLEITIQDMTGTQVYDGETAWAQLPFAGSSEPVVMPEDQAQLMREQADLDGPLVDWQEKGHQLELVGKETTGGAEAYHVRAELAGGTVRDFFIDAETSLLVRQEATVMVQGEPMEIETIFSDHRKVGDIVVAHTIESKPKEAPSGQVLKIDSIDIGIEIAEDFFDMPSAGLEGADETGGE